MDSGSFSPTDFVTVNVTAVHAVTVAEVRGEIDMATCDAMAEPLFEQLDAAHPGLVVDLSEVEFMGSAGLAVLIEAHQRTQQGTTTLAIVAPDQSPASRALTVSGLVQFLPVHRTVHEAMRSMPAAERSGGQFGP
jgi:anti-sigma B factor antagonist